MLNRQHLDIKVNLLRTLREQRYEDDDIFLAFDIFATEALRRIEDDSRKVSELKWYFHIVVRWEGVPLRWYAHVVKGGFCDGVIVSWMTQIRLHVRDAFAAGWAHSAVR